MSDPIKLAADRLRQVEEEDLRLVSVAVWWSDDRAYGGRSDFDDEDSAWGQVEKLRRLGYGRNGTEIHILRTTRTVEVVEPQGDGA